MNACTAPRNEQFELRFVSLFSEGRGLTFPCDRAGQVARARLSARAPATDEYAPSTNGRDVACPAVTRATVH